MTQRTVTAMYDTRGAAETARDGLMSLGVSSGDVSIRGTEGDSTSSSTSTSGGTEDRGFWAELKDLFVPDEDRYAYAEGMRRGNHLLTARVDEGMVDEALEVLERSGPVDVDERAESWKSEGWNREGYRDYGTSGMGAGAVAGSTAAYGSGMAGTTTTGYSDTAATGYTTDTTTTTTTTTGRDRDVMGAAAVRTGAEGDVVERAEEQLRVGKREVGRGSVRVRSYVTETPVEEQVTLRDERVEIERRPVDRPVRAGDDVFREREISATERREEAVVSKEARVVEEIGLRKEGGERTETVRDTVRRQEVEVDDERTAGTRSGLTGGGTTTTGYADTTTTGTTGTSTSRDYGTGGTGRSAGERVSDAMGDAAEATGLKSDDMDEQRRGAGVNRTNKI